MPVGVLPVKTFISNRLLAVFACLIAKIIMLGKQLVKPIVHKCFHFLAYKNYNVGVIADMLVIIAFLSNIFWVIFAFLIEKMVIQRQ